MRPERPGKPAAGIPKRVQPVQPTRHTRIIFKFFPLGPAGPKMSHMDKLLLRPIEAAQVLGLGRSKCYELLASGCLPSIRIGGSIRVPVSALESWIRDRTAE